MSENVSGRQFQSIASKRGAEGEQRVSSALDHLQEEEFIISHWAGTQHDGHVLGIDHHILNNDGDTFGIQIKSSVTGAQNAEKLHPGVRVFITRTGETLSEIEERLVSQYSFRKRTE